MQIDVNHEVRFVETVFHWSFFFFSDIFSEVENPSKKGIYCKPFTSIIWCEFVKYSFAFHDLTSSTGLTFNERSQFWDVHCVNNCETSRGQTTKPKLVYHLLIILVAWWLYSSTTLKILFNFFGILSVISFCFLVELHVLLVDVIDVWFVEMLSSAMELWPFVDSV